MADRTTLPLLNDTPSSGRALSSRFIILLIVGLSLSLNLVHIQFGLPYAYGRNVEGRILDIAVRAFVTGDLNPHVSVYPHLQLYLLLIAFLPYYLWGIVTGTFSSRADLLHLYRTDPTSLFVISRSVTALFGTGCVWMVYLITRRYYGKKIALVAALFLACFPLLVTNSHMVTPDVVMTFFILVSFYYATKLFEEGSSRDYFLSGAALGLAFTSKYPAAIAAVSILCAHLLRRRSGEDEAPASRPWGILPTMLFILLGIVVVAVGLLSDFSFLTIPFNRRIPGSAGKIRNAIHLTAVLGGIALAALPYLANKIRIIGTFTYSHRRLMMAVIGCVLLVFAGSPYLWIDFSLMVDSLVYHALTESKPFWGSEETPAGWVHYLYLVKDGTGLPVLVLSMIGLGYLLYRHRHPDLLLLSFPGIYYLFMGSFETKFPRYMIPILPFLAIFSALLIRAVGEIGGENRRERLRRISSIVIPLLIIPSFLDVVRWDAKMGRTNTRTLAKEWIESNIPRGSRIAIDALGPPLSESDYQLFVYDRGKLRSIRDPWAHYHLGEAKDLQVLLKEGIEYVVVNSNTYGNYQRIPHFYPEEYAFYVDLDSSGKLIQEFSPGWNPGPEIKIYFLLSEDTAPGAVENAQPGE